MAVQIFYNTYATEPEKADSLVKVSSGLISSSEMIECVISSGVKDMEISRVL